MNLLLVEDNESIAKSLMYTLVQNNYKVSNTKTVLDTLNILKEKEFNLLIIDVTLPDGNGFDLYQKIKEKYNYSAIFLTANDNESDIVKGLLLGAEDYITKPFKIRELLVRIDKILLRSKQNSNIKVKDITFDMDKMIVYKDNKEISLTPLELKVLNLLFINLNKVVTRDYIIKKIWDWTGNDVFDNTVTVYLKRIRKKLDSDIIKTIKSVGYRIDSDEK